MGTLNVRRLARSRVVRGVSAAVLLAFVAEAPNAQFFNARDPGPRSGAVGAGEALGGLTGGQRHMFDEGKAAFVEVNSVKGTIDDTEPGLGPRFNSDSCGSCHSHPNVGGSSPPRNPQIAVATKAGARNGIPFFVRPDGPVREARFRQVVRNGQLTDTPDGGVHALFTITGRTDATNVVGATGQAQTCRLSQPDFDLMRRLDNIEFRIPTPTFGLGLIESITDAAILSNMNANGAEKRNFGISGRPNRNGNDGTITKFGWKAQNVSLTVFSGEAYNVEQGVTNELFQNERGSPGEILPVECLFNGTPEDATNLEDLTGGGHSDMVLFAVFMRFLAPPVASATEPGGAASIQTGAALFRDTMKCALCHTPSLPTGWSSVSRSLGPSQANLYSDLLLHNMGSRLADGISQGAATGNEFRTAPLWGLGQRVFFLHDGRSKDLEEVIQLHGDRDSEARGTVAIYNRLSERDKQHVLNFLRSL
jgi:CxxC motif-containing protein (DUF1111 family)